MYEPHPESDILQGDVFRDVVSFESPEPNVTSSDRSGQQVQTTTLTLRRVSSFVAILSHSCDSTLANKSKRTRLVVSPLIVPDDGLVKRVGEVVGELENLDRTPEVGKAGFLHLFYYAPYPPAFDTPRLVDFSNPRSVRTEDLALGSKVLQLTQATRDAFRIKLGAHFARAEEP